MKTILAAAGLSMLAFSAQAATTTIDFESFATGTTIAGTDLGGLTLATGFVTSGPNGTNAILPTGSDYTQKYRADFLATDVTAFSVDMGDYGQDADTLFLFAYDSLGNELDSATGTLAAGVSGMTTLNVSSLSNIAYVIFFGEGFNTQNNVYADNLSFTTTPAVPLPAGLVLMGSALAGFGLIRRKG